MCLLWLCLLASGGVFAAIRSVDLRADAASVATVAGAPQISRPEALQKADDGSVTFVNSGPNTVCCIRETDLSAVPSTASAPEESNKSNSKSKKSNSKRALLLQGKVKPKVIQMQGYEINVLCAPPVAAASATDTVDHSPYTNPVINACSPP